MLLVVKVSVLVTETTWPIFPPPASAKVLSPLKNVDEFLVPVAVSLASETVLSDGTPRSRTDPSIWIKFITSPVTNFIHILGSVYE